MYLRLKKLWKELGSPVIDVTVKKRHFSLVYALKCFGILAGYCGSVGAGERDWDTNDPGSRSGLDPGLRFTFFLIETLDKSKRAQTFSKCPKNGSAS